MNLRFEEEAKKEKRKRLIKETIRYVLEIVLVVVLAWCIINLCLKKITIIGSAMETTIDSGEEVIVNTFFNNFISPDRGSVIAFYPEKSSEGTRDSDVNILVRRVVGLPGETVLIQNGTVYIDGDAIKEDYEFDKNVSSGIAEQDYQLGDDEYFVLSDKRTDLDDSRSASFTKVKRDNIIGSVFFAINPMRFISGPKENESEDESGGETESA